MQMDGMTPYFMSVVQCPEKSMELLTLVITPKFQVPVSQWEYRVWHR